jgi:hypothetical protein
MLQWCYSDCHSGVTVVLPIIWFSSIMATSTTAYSGVTAVLQWCYSGATVVLESNGYGLRE